MQSINTDQIAFLEEAKKALLELNEAKMTAGAQETQVKKLEKNLAAEKKAVAESIDLTIKKRKAEITASYDDQIETTLGQLKKVKSRRDKAKRKAMKDRMEEETAEIYEDNRRLSMELKTLFRQNRVPKFCNTTFFYSMYYARSFGEILTFLLVLILCFVAFPVGLYQLLGGTKIWLLILIYVLDIFLFGGLYFTINNVVKVRHHESLAEGRKIRGQIRANKKKIRAITNSIQKDKNEDGYDLGSFDEEIRELEQEKREIAEQKQNALTNFENNGKLLIRQEIASNNQERLDKLEEETNAAILTLNQFQAQVKVLSMQMAERYEPMLGREFLQVDKMDQLRQVFENGMASNMSEAQELVRAGRLTPTLTALPGRPGAAEEGDAGVETVSTAKVVNVEGAADAEAVNTESAVGLETVNAKVSAVKANTVAKSDGSES